MQREMERMGAAPALFGPVCCGVVRRLVHTSLAFKHDLLVCDPPMFKNLFTLDTEMTFSIRRVVRNVRKDGFVVQKNTCEFSPKALADRLCHACVR